MCWRQTEALLEGHSSYGVPFAMSSNDPERAARARSASGFTQDNGQVPFLFASAPTGRIGYKDLAVLDPAQDHVVARSSKVALAHEDDH